MKTENKAGKFNKYEMIYLIMVFLFFCVFFIRIHPLQVLDTDDWGYISFHRYAIPVFGAWNPTRVFPEIVISFLASVSQICLLPMTENFLSSITILFGFVAALILTLLMSVLLKFLDSLRENERVNNIAITVFALISHFIIFRTSVSDNMYMLWTHNANCFFYYLASSILNLIIVLWIMVDDIFTRLLIKGEYAKKAVFVFLVYFALFSNLFSTIILGSYICVDILFSLTDYLKEKNLTFKQFLFSIKEKLILLIAWGVVHIFEAFGGRATKAEGYLCKGISESFKYVITLPSKMNGTFMICTGMIVITAILIFILIKGRECPEKVYLKKLLLAWIITIVYLVLLTGKLGDYYDRPDAMYGMFIYFILILALLLKVIMRELPVSKIIIPLIMVVMVSAATTNGRTYAESNVLNLSPSECTKISEDIIEQFVMAEECGTDEMVLEVPVFGASDNWPLATYGGQAISDTLYKYRIINSKIRVTEMIPTESRGVYLSDYLP